MQKVKFLLAILTVCILSFLFGLNVGKPKGFTTLDAYKSFNKDLFWTHGTKNLIIGNFFIMIPKNQKNSSIAFFYKGNYPFALFNDLDSDGLVDEIALVDSSGRTAGVTIGSDSVPKFDSAYLTVSGTPNIDAITYIDKDFNGKFDIRFEDSNGSVQEIE